MKQIPLTAKSGFEHTRIWWLCSSKGNSQPLKVFADTRKKNQQTYRKMLANLDRADKTGKPPSLPSQYNPTSEPGVFEFKVNKPSLLRLYVTPVNGGWLILYGANSKKTQSDDIQLASKRLKQVKKRGCNYE